MAFLRLRACVLLCLFLGVIVPPVLARGAESSIGVVDVKVIFAQADASKDIESQREKLREAFLQEISKTESDLHEEELALSSQMKTLSPEEFTKRRAAYEENLIKTRKLTQEKKRLLEEASSKAMDRVREELYLVVQEIANERGYSLVISNRDVIAGEKSLDITAEALKRLNAKIKTVALEIQESE